PALLRRPASITRPRRVGSSASQDTSQTQSSIQSSEAPKSQDTTQSPAIAEAPQGPPTLIGSEPARPLAPPMLAKANATATASPQSDPDKVSPASGPEEVSEGDVVRVETS